MKNQKKPDETKLVSVDIIKKYSVPKELPKKRKENYNPHISEDGLASKIWELLRRNASFQNLVKQLVVAGGRDGFEGQKKAAVARLLSKIDRKHRMAGYVLRWIFEPEFINLNDIPDIFSAGFLNVDKGEYVQKTLPYLDPDMIKEIDGMNFADFCMEYPIYLLRDRSVFQWDGCSDYSQNADEPILGLLWDIRRRTDYVEKLTFDRGGFDLNTPWPQTPELFRRQFEWLWAHHDINQNSPFTGSRKYFPGSGSASWILDESEDTIERSELWNFYRTNYELIGIPTNYIYSEKNLNELVANIKEHLSLVLKWRHLIVNGPRIKSAQQYPQILGGKNDWEAYIFCWPLLRLSNGNCVAAGCPSFDVALEKLLDHRKDMGKKGKEASQIKKNLIRMIELSNCIYPELKIGSLLKN